MIRKLKLIRIRKVRATMSELATCENLGRARFLLLKMPNVTGYQSGYTSSYEVQKFTTIKMRGGYEYNFTGFGDIILGVKAGGAFAYNKWLKNYFG